MDKAYVWKFMPRPLFNLTPSAVNSVLDSTFLFFNSLSNEEKQVAMRVIIHNAPYSLKSYVQYLTTQAGKHRRNHWASLILRSMAEHISGIDNLYQPYVYLVLFGSEKQRSKLEAIAMDFANRTGMTEVQSPSTGARLPDIFQSSAVGYEDFLYVPPSSLPASRYGKKERGNGRYWRFYYIANVYGTLNFATMADPLFSLQHEWMLSWDLRFPLRQVWPAKIEMRHLQKVKGQARTAKQADSKWHKILALTEAAISDFREGRDAMVRTLGVFGIAAQSESELSNASLQAESIFKSNFDLAKVPGGHGGSSSVSPLVMFTTNPFPVGMPVSMIERYLRATEIAYGNLILNGAPRPGGGKGVYWGRSLENRHPIIVDLWENPKNANHALILGQTGSGKTVTLQTYASRYLAMGVRVIVLEPQGHFERLYQMVGDKAGHINHMSFDNDWSLNIMERLYSDPSIQANHVVNQLALLLGKTFTDTERAVLIASLTNLYRQYGDGTLSLSSLVDELGGRRWRDTPSPDFSRAAIGLSETIRLMVVADEGLNRRYGSLTRGLVLNPADKDLLVFNFRGVPTEGENERFLTLMYYQILSHLEHHVKTSTNHRPTLLIVDEYYRMSQNSTLSVAMNNIFKTYRTFGVAAWLAGQNLAEFVGGAHKNYLIANAPHFLLFKMGPAEVRDLKMQLPHIDPRLLESLVEAEPGYGLLVLAGREPTSFYNELTDVEREFFVGT